MYFGRRVREAVGVPEYAGGGSKLKVSSGKTADLGKSFRFPIKLLLKDHPLFDVVSKTAAAAAAVEEYLRLLCGFFLTFYARQKWIRPF